MLKTYLIQTSSSVFSHGLLPNVDHIQEDEEVAAEDEEDMGVIETYSNYKPSKLKVTL